MRLEAIGLARCGISGEGEATVLYKRSDRTRDDHQPGGSEGGRTRKFPDIPALWNLDASLSDVGMRGFDMFRSGTYKPGNADVTAEGVPNLGSSPASIQRTGGGPVWARRTKPANSDSPPATRLTFAYYRSTEPNRGAREKSKSVRSPSKSMGALCRVQLHRTLHLGHYFFFGFPTCACPDVVAGVDGNMKIHTVR